MTQTAVARPGKPGGRPTRQEAENRLTRVIDIARRHFLAVGYRETSLESIASEAGIAKKTLYHHFGSKAGLFATIIEALRRAWIAKLRDVAIVSHGPEHVLEEVALHLLEIGTRPDMIELHRLFLMEAHRFPDLIRGNYDEDGSLRGMEPLANYLHAAVSKGTLKIDDAALATEQFTFLVLGGIRGRLLLGAARRPSASERRRMACQAVRIFLTGCKV